MRRFLGLVVVAILVTGLSCGDDDDDSGDAPAAGRSSGKTQAFFSQTAQRGTLVGDRLVLDGVAASMTAIADRPSRSLQRLSVAGFVDGWSARFDGDPPNAVLAGDGRRAERSVALALDKPSYDAARDRLIYEAKPIGGSSRLPSARLAAVSLVIDFAPETIYAVRLRKVGADVSRTLALTRIADMVLTITDAAREGEIDVRVVGDPMGGEFEVDNDSDGEIDVDLSKNDVPFRSATLVSDGKLEVKSP